MSVQGGVATTLEVIASALGTEIMLVPLPLRFSKVAT